jgi:sarcosine oxidase subunit alpha
MTGHSSEPAAATDHAAPDGAPQGLTFDFEGRAIDAVPGQSIAAALYAAGVRIFSRSFKYHRPRGLFCCTGDCPSCLMQVDGRPNVRTCIEPARSGQLVARQNAWPFAEFDVLHVFNWLDRFLPVGFYYKQFHRPRWIWPLFEHSVRHIAGLGRVDTHSTGANHCDVEHVHCDVCVVGAGPAGIAAAAAAVRAGCTAVVVERAAGPGGDVLHRLEVMKQLEDSWVEVEQSSHARVLFGTTAFGLYEGNLLGAFQGDRLLKVRAKQVIVCSGGRERPFVFPNNDLPGIMLGGGALRLACDQNVRPGERAVVLTDGLRGHRVASELAQRGVEVVRVVDMRPADNSALPDAALKVSWSSGVLAAIGHSRLRGVRVGRLADDGSLVAGTEQHFECDLLCLAPELVPANELLLQAGVRFQFDGGRWVPTQAVSGVSGAGAVVGTIAIDEQIMEGGLRGAEAAALVGRPVADLEEMRSAMMARRASAPARVDPGNTSAAGRGAAPGKRFICLCEDVTDNDLDRAIAEGFDGIETLKRYSTVNMGPCQGKMCGTLAVEHCARATKRPTSAVGVTTSRPPVTPVDLCVLAAASHHPVRRTALHHWHESAGARWMDAGQWKRPESYGDPEVEVRTVRSAAGLIDVSTLGKFEVVGPDAARLLDRIYINQWSDLRAGRARYGVMCNEDGIIFDDGVGARLAPDRFYLTATTGNADGVLQWLELWRDTWGFDATIVNHTSGMAAMNVAGPRARDVLKRLTGLDLANAAFPYMSLRQGDVAEVPCRLLRIGFVGELGYEIHCPGGLAWGLWESLCDAGREFGLKPFGVEAQRILRLEKGHFIVGADTDALSNPLEAGLEAMVKFDKAEFIGRPPLVRLRERGPRARLVGFVVPQQPHAMLEGSQIVEAGVPVGRITSARISPTMGASLGMAWVPVRRAAAGSRFQIRHNGSDVDGIVTPLPFYDPHGTRLKM